LDRNFVYFIFTRTDNWSKLQLKEVASIQEKKEAILNIGTLIRSMNDYFQQILSQALSFHIP